MQDARCRMQDKGYLIPDAFAGLVVLGPGGQDAAAPGTETRDLHPETAHPLHFPAGCFTDLKRRNSMAPLAEAMIRPTMIY